ncbi:DUF1850 domain-containing protein [Sporosarcina sp. NPDC096371]|uniref:DUF1850 domain-containing protein n=1 Tax=Sporosarcina sp. NPDC096371 TaxID=3364530 RepID=UPI003800E0B4
MKRKVVVPLILLVVFTSFILFFIPMKEAFTFTEQRTEDPEMYYIPLKSDRGFQIRYVHSIHLTDVFENYEVTVDHKIKLLSMQYENLAIGLPGSAEEEGESFSFKDGVYTLTYDDKVIDSFVLFIGDVDAELAFRYLGNEINLKQQLERGKSYAFRVTKLSYYQMLKGGNLNGNKETAAR